jgi:ribosome-interacting GTPase 1
MELVDKMAREPNSIVISCSMDLSRSTESWQPIVTLRTDLRSEQGLLDTLWDSLGLLRIYTKKRGDVGLPRR